MADIVAHIGNAWAAKRDPRYTVKLAKDALDAGANFVSFDLLGKLYRDDKLQASASQYILPIEYVEAAYEEVGDLLILAPHDPGQVNEVLDMAHAWLIPTYNVTVRPLLEKLHGLNQRVLLETCHLTNEEIAQVIEGGLTGFDPDALILMHTAAGQEPGDLMMRHIVDLWGDFYNKCLCTGFSALEYTYPPVLAMATLYNAEVIKVNFDSGDGVDAHRSLDINGMRQLRELVDKAEAARDCGCVFPLADRIYRDNSMRDAEDYLRPSRGGHEEI